MSETPQRAILDDVEPVPGLRLRIVGATGQLPGGDRVTEYTLNLIADGRPHEIDRGERLVILRADLRTLEKALPLIARILSDRIEDAVRAALGRG